MSDLRSLFSPLRTRPDAAPPAQAPERRTNDTRDIDFARSLAAVRGLERSAAAPSRPAPRMPARAIDRHDDRATARTTPTSPAQSRTQVNDLMLSGAMKFAAGRSMPSGSTTPDAQTPSTPADLTPVAANPMAAWNVDASPDAEATELTEVAPEAVVAIDATVNEPEATAAQPLAPVQIWSTGLVPPASEMPAVEATSAGETIADPVLSGSAAAAAAAMQLIATLPIPVAVETPDEMQDASTPSDLNDEYRRAAWNQQLAAHDAANGTATLVEDHFDAPAVTTTTALDAMADPLTLESLLPANVSITFADIATAVTERADRAADLATAAASDASVAKEVRTALRAIERDVAQLAPAFRERLQRVIERMQKEFGHDVSVVETVRSQARQDALFAQGRTAPGPVVTWTRNSKHSKGLAADLMVDGQWDNPTGYAHLAQIAREEGLRTLGARDPGHVEQPQDGGVSADTLGTLLGDLAGDAGDAARKARADTDAANGQQAVSGIARVAEVAQVARVARVADVARVASVARPGSGASHSESGAGQNVSPLAVSGAAPQFMTDGSAALRVTAPVTGVNMADRISHLMDLQATQSAKPLNSVLLRMDNANGIEDQIRIDTRGTSVDAQLGLGSAQQAAELGARVNELREALERRGLTADGVRVQAAPRATDSVQFTRTVTPGIEVAAMRAAAESQAQGQTRDQASRDQQHREAMAREQDRPTPRSSSDDARHRSRREQPETRQ